MASIAEVKEKLDRKQALLRSLLDGKSLITEILREDRDEDQAIVSVSQIAKVLKAYGVDRYLVGGASYPRIGFKLLDSWSELVSIGMAATASKFYTHGTYWPLFFEEIKFPDGQKSRAMWADHFHTGISRLGLPSFRELPLANLGPILMHAGVPTYCLPDMYRAILLATQKTGRDSHDVITFLNKQFESGSVSADVPVQRFLKFGGEFADDLVDRVITILYSGMRGDIDSSNLLPQRFYEAAKIVLEESDRNNYAGEPSRYLQSRVSLNFNFRDLTIELDFPSIAVSNGGSNWNVRIDQNTGAFGVATPRGQSYRIDHFSILVSQPSREIEITYPTDDGRIQRLPLIDPSIPILLFRQNGSQVETRGSVTGEPTWIVYPSGEDIYFGDRSRVIQSEESIGNWYGWRCQLVSWNGADRIKYQGKSVVEVKSNSLAKFEFDHAVEGLWLDGMQVHSSMPRLFFPEDSVAESSISGTNLTQRKTIDFSLITTGEPELPQEMHFGALELVVRGGLGKVSKYVGAVLQDAHLTFQPSVRTFDPSGLTPCTATLTFGGDIFECILSPTDTIGEMVLKDGTVLEVRPPLVRVRYKREFELSEWFTSPIAVEFPKLNETYFVVEVPGQVGSLDINAVGIGVNAKLSGKRIRATNQFEFNLRELALPRDVPVGSLYIESEIYGHALKLARVSPSRMCDSIDIESNVLKCIGLQVPFAEAFIWPVLAPWMNPFRVEFDKQGQVALPSELISVGDLLISVLEVDPWVPNDFVSAQDRRKTRIHRPVLGDSPELLKFITGLSEEIPQDLIESDAWDAIRSFEASPQLDVDSHKIHDLRLWLRKRPGRAVIGLNSLRVQNPSLVASLISTDLVFCDASTGIPTNSLAQVLFSNSLFGVLTGLQTAACQEGLESKELLSHFKDVLGKEVISILQLGVDPSAKVGVFDRGALLLNTWSSGAQEEQFAKWKTIPRAKFDGDARFVAIENLFRHRDDKSFRSLTNRGTLLVQEVIELLNGKTPTLNASSIIQSRLNRAVSPRGWTTLPAISLAFALMARAIAHGLVPRQLFPDEWKFEWRKLADVAEDYVSLDIALAECFILFAMSNLAETKYELKNLQSFVHEEEQDE